MRFNIYHRRDGRWEGRISLGKNDIGIRKFQYVFGRTREQVKDRIVRIKQENRGFCNISFSAVFDDWTNTKKHVVKESTLANYRLKAKKHVLPAFGKLEISAVTSELIYEFIRQKQASGLSNRYIDDILILMKSVFKYAVKTYHIYNPMDEIVMPRKGKSEVRLLDGDEQKTLRGYVSNNHNITNMGIALTMTAGLRIGELCALTWQDVDLEKRILTVRKTVQRIQSEEGNSKTKVIITDPKSESSKRVIPITKKMAEYLAEYKGENSYFILSGTQKPLEPRTLQYRFAKLLKNVNLPSIHFHALRHMFASNCIKLGFDVKALSELLGHSSVEITLNRYVHSSFEQKREYMDRIEL